MLYITGIHALNLNFSLLTCGDWHQSGIQWRNIPLFKSDNRILGDYGIEFSKKNPEHVEFLTLPIISVHC